MKEYICKEDLMRAHFANTPVTDNEDIIYTHVLMAKWIKDVPTVTKADICQEFGERIKELVLEVVHKYSLIYDVIKRAIDSALTEMEVE